VNVLVNKNAPFLRGGGDKVKYFVVVVSVVVVVVADDVDGFCGCCCGDIIVIIVASFNTHTVKLKFCLRGSFPQNLRRAKKLNFFS